MTRRATLGFLLALSCTSPGAQKRERDMIQANTDAPQGGQAASLLKREAQEAAAQSRRYFTIDALPARERLRQAAQAQELSLEGMTPLERFFVVAASPAAATKAGAQAVAQSYCAALKSLPADWWGLPGETDTAIGQTLLGLGRSTVPCLVELLGDAAPLSYLNGESNAMSQEFSYGVADLAAGFLARILHEPFDGRAGAEERRAAREQLRIAARR